jgi:ABC-2 type transport system ATP-binding protein
MPLAISVQGLQRRFGGLLVPSLPFTLTVQPGDCVALAGPNGSGKSTVLRLLSGLLAAAAGTGHILGQPLGRLDARARRQLGLLPQRSALHLRLPVIESLRFRAAVAGLEQPLLRAKAVLAAMGIAARQYEPLHNFSGGWIRRLEVAATLLHEPRLALLDEPTSGIDAEARQAIWEQLRAERARGLAIVFSSHDAVELRQADYVVTLDKAAAA